VETAEVCGSAGAMNTGAEGWRLHFQAERLGWARQLGNEISNSKHFATVNLQTHVVRTWGIMLPWGTVQTCFVHNLKSQVEIRNRDRAGAT
jgi:hypothetical protein